MNLSCMIGPRWSSTTGMSAALLGQPLAPGQEEVGAERERGDQQQRDQQPLAAEAHPLIKPRWRPTGQPYNQRVAKKDSAVYVAPLGGVGEVGKNATLLECR